MLRKLWLLGVLALSGGGLSAADDETIPLGRFKPSAGGFGGTATTAAATTATEKDPTAGDTENVWYRRGYYGGYYGGYYAYYRPAYFGFTYYRPIYTTYYYPRPVYYCPPPVVYSNYYYPVAAAPVVVAPPVVLASNVTPSNSGPYRYDGGPANPVPQPAPDKAPEKVPQVPPRIEPANDSPSVTVSLPGKKSSYKYPAYGDKK